MDKQSIIKALRDFGQSASNTAADTVAVPVDLIASVLRSGGLDIPTPVGGSQWMADKGLTAPVEPGVAKALGESAGIIGPMVAAAKAPQIAKTLNQMGQNASARTMANRGQRGVISFPDSMTRQEKSLAVKSMADEAAVRLRSLGFDASVDHSGSALGPSSYVKVYDPKTGRFITDPLRISDHSKGAFNSQFVHDARGPEDIDAFIDAAQKMREMGPTDLMRQQQAQMAAQAQKARESWGAIYRRAMEKQQAGQQLSNKEIKAVEWVQKNGL